MIAGPRVFFTQIFTNGYTSFPSSSSRSSVSFNIVTSAPASSQNITQAFNLRMKLCSSDRGMVSFFQNGSLPVFFSNVTSPFSMFKSTVTMSPPRKLNWVRFSVLLRMRHCTPATYYGSTCLPMKWNRPLCSPSLNLNTQTLPPALDCISLCTLCSYQKSERELTFWWF